MTVLCFVALCRPHGPDLDLRVLLRTSRGNALFLKDLRTAVSGLTKHVSRLRLSLLRKDTTNILRGDLTRSSNALLKADGTSLSRRGILLSLAVIERTARKVGNLKDRVGLDENSINVSAFN